MKKEIITIAVVFLLLIGVVGAQDAIAPGSSAEGTYTGEAIAYTMDATQGQLLIISVESEDFDARAAIAQGGMELAEDDDSGEGNNALLAYVVQEDGAYEILVDAFYFSSGEGGYVLTVDAIEPAVVEMGGTVTLEPEDPETLHLYTVFSAAAGDVVNVWAATADEDDIEATLFGPDAEEIESDDDDGADDDALIRRVVLEDDGLYLVRVNHSWDDPLTAGAEVTVEKTEQIYLSAEPQELVLGDGVGQKGTEVYTVDVEPGVTYRFIVEIQSFPDEDAGIEMELLDTEFFFAPTLDTRHATGATWEWLSNTQGTIRLDVHPNFFGRDISSIQYMISLEIIE